MHLDLLARICKLVDRKKFGLICFPRLIYCDQEPLLLLNLTVDLLGCYILGYINSIQDLFHSKITSLFNGSFAFSRG